MSATTPIDAGTAWYHTRTYLTGRPLTALEFRAVDLAGDGLTDAEIGARLHCTEDMAGQAVHRAAWKLDTRGRAGALGQLYLRGLLKQPAAPNPPTTRLPRRESEVLRLYADGLTDGQIAARLGVGVGTVERHGKRLRKSLEARDRAHAVRRALETGAMHLALPAERTREAAR